MSHECYTTMDAHGLTQTYKDRHGRRVSTGRYKDSTPNGMLAVLVCLFESEFFHFAVEGFAAES